MTTPLTPPISLGDIEVRVPASGPTVKIFSGEIAWGYGTILRSNDVSSTEFAAQAQDYASDDPPVYLRNYDGTPMETFIVNPDPAKHYRLSCAFAVQVPGTLAADLTYSICVSRDGGVSWVPYSTTLQQLGKTGDATDQWAWCRVNTGWQLGSRFAVQAGDPEIRARVQFQASLA